jgi:hypothetical protein
MNVHRFLVQSRMALIVAANLPLGIAAPPAVGTVTARGSFTIDASTITGNATLFEGNQIETGKISSQLQLNNGARMQLAAESRGIVYRDRLVLEKGTSWIRSGANSQVEANSLRIRPASETSGAQISIRQSGTVQVAALSGPVRVTAANGVLLANLQEGKTLDFTPDATGPATPTTVTGCLENSSGKFLLTDEASLVRFEVMGTSLDKEVGRRVQVDGAVTPVPDSLSQIQSTNVKELSKKCSHRGTAAAAAGVGAAGAAGAGAGSAGAGTLGGIGAAIASHAVIAGVIVAGVATGAAVAIVKTNGSSSTPASISPSNP